MISLPHAKVWEFRFARACFSASALLFLAKLASWGMADLSYARLLFVGTGGAVIAVALTVSWSWVINKEQKLSAHTEEESSKKSINEPPKPIESERALGTPATAFRFASGSLKNKLHIGVMSGYNLGGEIGGTGNEIDIGQMYFGPAPKDANPNTGAVVPGRINPGLERITNKELKLMTDAMVSSLETIQSAYHVEFERILSGKLADPKGVQPSLDNMQMAFGQELDLKGIRPSALALRNELMIRLQQPLTFDLQWQTILLSQPRTPLRGHEPLQTLINVFSSLEGRLTN